jgi:GTP diphosphokinase / guanosine-3',5'-bis(diphosphate) 3'-diphosphatase
MLGRVRGHLTARRDVHRRGGAAVGTEAIGPSALGGSALSGSALGGSALGGSALGGPALGGPALGGPALGRTVGALAGARTRGVRLTRLARRLLGRISPGGSMEMPPELRRVADTHRLTHPHADLEPIRRAYYVAERLHAGQLRHSGDPYITHPLAVAEILAELGVDTTTLVAALLHDTVEDTGYTLEAVEAEFGNEVAMLVDGVTKLDKMRFGEAAEAETLRKLIVALARDYRVLVIKIADRLHNMRTLGFKSPAKQQRIARVTLEVLSPLAHRLGVSVIKRELEDRAFEVLQPADYARIRARVEAFTDNERDAGGMAAVVAGLSAALVDAKIKATVSARTSHYFSIWKRAQERGREARDVNDIVRVLVLVDSITDCYAALGIAHALWRPAPGRLRDFVATPKFNMYQSLHTSVVDLLGRPVDIQIRTESMHRLAETGIVARPVGPGADGARLEGLAWLRSLLDWQADAPDPGEFLESLSADLDADEVLTFTPIGDTLALPTGSTPVDFAYAVHTALGHRCIGARVNGRLVPLQTRLRSGDVVEVLTSDAPDAGPSEHWLTFVKTAKARVKIRRMIRQRPDPGQLSPSVLPPADLPDGELPEADTDPRPPATEDAAPAGRAGEVAASAGWAALADRGDVPVRLARCCLPLPGDAVVGFSTQGRGVSLHRGECGNVASASAARDRVSVTSWAVPPDATFPATIAVEAFDRYGLLADITQALCDASASVRSASTTTRRDRVAHARFTVEVGGHDQLEELIEAVREVEGVYDCYRATVATT